VGIVKEIFSMKGEDTPPAPTEGRSVFEPKSILKSVPVITAKGRPDENSMMGERTNPASIFRYQPAALVSKGLSNTALATNRWR